jgi:hypothetical protein
VTCLGRGAGLAAAGVLAAACSSSGHPTAPVRTPTPAVVASPSQRSSPTSAAAGPATVGGSVAAYKAAHPDGRDGYGPAASLDGFTVLAFTRTLAAPQSVDALRSGLRANLPPDARQVADIKPDGLCEQIWFVSEQARTTLGPKAYLFVVLRSAGALGRFEPAAVTTVAFDANAAAGPGSVPC